MRAEHQYKRGDMSPCGTKRFWKYQTYVSKKTGQRCQMWIPFDQYERYKKQTQFNEVLSSARSEFVKMQQAKYKKAA